MDDWTALHFAANEGHLEIILELLSKNVNVFGKSCLGRTALHLASIRSNLSVIKALINSGIDINSQDNDFYTCLHYASENGHKEVVEFLIKNKPDVNLKNHQGNTAFDCALNSEIQDLFHKFGLVNKDNINYYGRTSFGSVFLNGRADIVNKLLYVGKKIKT